MEKIQVRAHLRYTTNLITKVYFLLVCSFVIRNSIHDMVFCENGGSVGLGTGTLHNYSSVFCFVFVLLFFFSLLQIWPRWPFGDKHLKSPFMA